MNVTSEAYNRVAPKPAAAARKDNPKTAPSCEAGVEAVAEFLPLSGLALVVSEEPGAPEENVITAPKILIRTKNLASY